MQDKETIKWNWLFEQAVIVSILRKIEKYNFEITRNKERTVVFFFMLMINELLGTKIYAYLSAISQR